MIITLPISGILIETDRGSPVNPIDWRIPNGLTYDVAIPLSYDWEEGTVMVSVNGSLDELNAISDWLDTHPILDTDNYRAENALSVYIDNRNKNMGNS